MSELYDLARMEQGDLGVVREVKGGRGFLRKLENLGIHQGSRIRKVSNVFSRGPVVFSVGDTEVAIGYGMARKILVELTGRGVSH